MNQSGVDNWLKLYRTAWMQQRPDLIKELFTQDATYSEKPFEGSFQGIDAITRYWEKISKTQKDVFFDYGIICIYNNIGIAHFTASFFRKPDQLQIKLDGIFKVELDSQNKCTSFSEWWQSQKTRL